MFDVEKFVGGLHEYIERAFSPVLQRLAVLEDREAQRGEKGDPGASGERGFTGYTGAQGEKGDAGERGLQGEKGEPGVNGRDADPIDAKDIVAELLGGPEIKTLVDLHVAEAVEKFFGANPVQHGKDGRDGKDGAQGLPGDRGEKGETGSDGIGQAGAMIDRDGCLIITTTKGEAVKLGVVVGRDGATGKDGADFTDATFDYDGVRTLTIKGRGGEITKTLPVPIDRGYWAEGKSAEKGDIFTESGSAWIALRDTKAKPGHESKEDWRLFARKGKDGVDGRNGRDLGPAPPVKLGGGNA
jgi:hypothetical protein